MPDGNKKVLVVAFDGLDYKLLQDFACKSILQEDFGKIDIQDSVEKIITWELFATFLTGKSADEHGVIGKQVTGDHALLRFSESLNKFRFFRKWAGIRTRILRLFGIKGKPAWKDKLGINTIFDDVPNSKALFVPVETKGAVGLNPWSLVDDELFDDSDFEEAVEKEHNWRKKRFFEEINKGYDLLMVHFHKPDWYQHVYGDKEINYEESVLRRLYEEMDDLAAEILNQAENFDVILFMSDHGLPEKDHHNENAFYSLNRTMELDNPTLIDLHAFVKNNVPTNSASSTGREPDKEFTSRDREVKKKLRKLGYLE